MEPDLAVARWGERFLAFLVDLLIIVIINTAVVAAVLPDTDLTEEIAREAFAETELESNGSQWFLATGLVPGLVSLAYFTGMEYATGTTVGRRLLRLRVVDFEGRTPPLHLLLISNVGKSFLLILDVILGLIFARTNRQRIFSKWSGIVVVKVQSHQYDQELRRD